LSKELSGPVGGPGLDPDIQAAIGLFFAIGVLFLRGGVEDVEFFSGLETNSFAGCDADFSASTGVTADAGFSRSNAEDAEAAQFDAIPCGESLLESLEDGVYRCLSFGPRQACPLDHVMDNILLDQF
jgi:hypothetical protein